MNSMVIFHTYVSLPEGNHLQGMMDYSQVRHENDLGRMVDMNVKWIMKKQSRWMLFGGEIWSNHCPNLRCVH